MNSPLCGDDVASDGHDSTTKPKDKDLIEGRRECYGNEF
jgi:hypothetical protein